jgi:hypothetical protein
VSEFEPIDESTIDGKLARRQGWLGMMPSGMMLHESGNQMQGGFYPTQNLHDLKRSYNSLTPDQKAIYEKLIVEHDLPSVFVYQYGHAEAILKASEVQA